MRLSPSWARSVLLLIDAKKTPGLALAAASFAQDVSKCRRIVLFVDRASDNSVTIPFVGLPSLAFGSEAPTHDVDRVVREALPTALADAFLDEDLTNTKLQDLVKEYKP